MDFEDLKGIVELGNKNIKCVIFRIKNNNDTEVLSTSVIESAGIHNGSVTNIIKASKAIRSCIGNAEKKIQVSLKKINVLTEQPEFLCTKLSKYRKINGSKIYKEDIEFLLKEGKKQITINDDKHSIVHIFNHNYIVDGKKFMEEPINVYADFLSHEMTFITMPKNNIKNIYQTFSECDLEVERFISTTFALSVHLLSNDELKFGSSLLDVGLDKISLGMFKNLALVHSTTFPFGIKYLAKDISKVCSLSIKETENVVNQINFSFKNNKELFDENNFLKKNYFFDYNYRKISKTLILKIITERLEEILKIIKKQIIEMGLNSTCSKNLTITGEGLKLSNLDEYFSEFFKLNVKKSIKNKKKEEIEEIFAACLGSLQIIAEGWETEAIPKKPNEFGGKSGFFDKIFGKRLSS